MGFIRKKEDFRCEVCSELVKGDGYTDHCPKCLWGKHMDEAVPGDRASECHGLMEPVGVMSVNSKWIIYYKCVRCGKKFKVGAGENDDSQEIQKLGTEIIRE